MMPNKKSNNISFRFNNSQGSIEEQISYNSNDVNQNEPPSSLLKSQSVKSSTDSEVADKKFKTLETSERGLFNDHPFAFLDLLSLS